MKDAWVVSAVAGAGIAVLLIKFAAIERRLNRLSRLDAKLDTLLEASEIAFDELRDVPIDVREALEQGNRILAIKRLRQATGLGLKEAADFVDEVRRRGLSAS